MDDFLAKPYRQGQLAAILGHWLGEDDKRMANHDGGGATAAATPVAEGAGVPASLPVLDPAVLRKMAAQYSHDSGFVGRIIGIFQTEAANRLAQLETARARDDRELLTRAVHSLKSSGASLGAARLAALCRELEEAARNGERPASLAERAAALPQEVAAVQAALATLREDGWPIF